MLGKTNITTLSESAIVTEIEDYSWIQMQSGVFGNFVKAIYRNGYLVGITADGTIVYTTDGEAWQTHVLEYEDCKLNDIEWDGSRFILVGGYSNNGEDTGLILWTEDLKEYVKMGIESGGATEYYAVYHSNGEFIIIAQKKESGKRVIYEYIGNLADSWKIQKKLIPKISSGYDVRKVTVAKNSSEMLLRINYFPNINSFAHWTDEIQKIDNTGEFTWLYTVNSDGASSMNVYECKDFLYYGSMMSADDYRIVKVSLSNESNIVSTGQDFSLKEGVYFNECQIFISNHEMLIVKKGESIADKTLDDLIEVAPEFTMNCITKAFGQLYIFGNQGLILKSSVETNNEEVLTVQTISAKKALLDSKKYTDERYTILEKRIAALESGGSDENI